jgi:type II secretory pathway predicted ATPase ExeA
LASILYGINSNRGFTVLIAHPGMGKTTLLFELLQKIKNSARTVFLFQSLSTPRDLLRSLLTDVGISDDGGDLFRMHQKLNEALLRESALGKRFVLFIDEAQNLDEPVLEIVRMLSNFETPSEKMMHIILAGQPQLADKLANPRLAQLQQRVSIFARLDPLSAEETGLYLDHRLKVAGYDFSTRLFTKNAQAMIADYAEGVPRKINNVCFQAITLGYVVRHKTIDVDIIKAVLDDLNTPFVGASGNGLRDERQKFSSPERPKKSLVSGLSVRLLSAVLLVGTLCGVLIWKNKHIGNMYRSQPDSNVERPSIPSAASQAKSDLHLVPSTQNGTPALPKSPTSDGSLSADFHAPDVAPPAVSPPEDSRFVTVPAHGTIYEIIMKNLGKYDAQTLAKIQELNPSLGNPRNIKAGQKLRLPPRSEPVATMRKSAVVDAPASSLAERWDAETRSQDPVEHARWLWAAVAQGNTSAEVTLAELYLIGQGVTQNCDQARVLLKAAAKKGSGEAIDKLAKLEQQGCP